MTIEQARARSDGSSPTRDDRPLCRFASTERFVGSCSGRPSTFWRDGSECQQHAAENGRWLSFRMDRNHLFIEDPPQVIQQDVPTSKDIRELFESNVPLAHFEPGQRTTELLRLVQPCLKLALGGECLCAMRRLGPRVPAEFAAYSIDGRDGNRIPLSGLAPARARPEIVEQDTPDDVSSIMVWPHRLRQATENGHLRGRPRPTTHNLSEIMDVWTLWMAPMVRSYSVGRCQLVGHCVVMKFRRCPYSALSCFVGLPPKADSSSDSSFQSQVAFDFHDAPLYMRKYQRIVKETPPVGLRQHQWQVTFVRVVPILGQFEVTT